MKHADPASKAVKAKWVWIHQGSQVLSEVCCMLVAQELRYGERLDEFFAGVLSWPRVKLSLC